MNPTEKNAILTIALLAAFADNSNTDAEREEVRRVAESLGGDDVNVAALYRDVLLKQATVAAAAAQLSSPEMKQLAFELAVGVCDADRLRNDAETLFLSELGNALGLSQPQIAGAAATVDALVTTPLASDAPAAQPGAIVASSPLVSGEELDKMVLNYAILNGALELLPQSMASMAIIPLQMKMVYRVGKAHGYELDRGHIKDLLAAMGVGLTGQYLEEIGRKLIGGLFGKAAGGMFGGLARSATSIAFSFATTYALGQVARRYYAGGRTMNAQMLKDAFDDMLGEGRKLQARYMPQIEQQARTVDVDQIVQMVRSR
ncbi:MAG: YcjF family protein [Gemmatimonadota bacterium]